jgi:photosystem II stability/assembly factor-like uncharacterized protein
MKTFLIPAIVFFLITKILFPQEWQPTNPINPLDARDMTVDQDGNLLCAVAGSVTGNFIQGAIFISEDQETWRPFWDNDEHYALTSLAVNEFSDIFAGSDSGGVYRTTDGGVTWETINIGLTSLRISRVNTDKPGYVFACTKDSGVFRSTNNGDNWTKINNGLTSTYIEAFIVNSNGDIFCGANIDPLLFGSGIFRSTDNGDNWLHPIDGVVVRDFAINPVNEYHFAVVNSAVYISTDEGVTWDFISNGSYRAIASDDLGNLFAGGGSAGGYVYQSTDNGSSWVQFYNGFIADVNDIYINQGALGKKTASNNYTGLRVIMATAEGVKEKILDTQEEIENNFGLSLDKTTTLEYSYGLAAQQNDILAAGVQGQGLYAVVWPSDDWFQPVVLGGSPLAAILTFAVSPLTSSIFTTAINTMDENVLVRMNNSLNAEQLFLFSDMPVGIIATITGEQFVATENKLYKIENDGNTITDITANMPAGMNKGIYYCGLHFYLVKEDNTVYKSIGGTSFEEVGLFGLPQDFQINSIYCDEYGEIYISGNLGVYYWDDSGYGVWTPIDDFGLPEGVGVVDFWTDYDEYYLLTEEGDIYYYEYNEWKKENLLLTEQEEAIIEVLKMLVAKNPATKITTLQSDTTNYAIFAATNHGVYYKLFDIITDVKSDQNLVPKEFILNQNYPNPFNPSTTISFSIPEEALVKLEIYNSLGKKASTLVSKELTAGNYKYEWNAKSLPSGIYFYKMTADNFVQTRKMILLK